ncbi:MAG: cobyrinate a,c-diamide synthase [Planctomycetota bacterium]
MSVDRVPRLIVAGTHSGVGKTTVSLGLMRAFARRGLRVAPYKVGPDYLDPGHHAVAAGRTGHNLDGWMLQPGANRAIFDEGARDADVAVIEGVMGLFDGFDGASEAGSTAQIAKWVDAPVVLVLDCFAMARSAGATVLGFAKFDPDLAFAGVLLNRVASAAHSHWLREAIEPLGVLEVLGALRHDPELHLPERHLGLVQAREMDGESRLERLADALEEAVDLDALLAAARAARRPPEARESELDFLRSHDGPARARVGVPRDDAFAFYYEANLAALRAAGSELVEFSSLEDPLPDGLDGLYLGGGYPELFAGRLASNRRLLEALRRFAASGRPIHAECGGLMWLGETLVVEGIEHRMAGVLPIATAMSDRLTLGYAEVESRGAGGPWPEGTRARGHRFHRSAIVSGPEANAWVLGDGSLAGFAQGGVQASYVHLHFGSNPALATTFVDACARSG